MTKPLTLFTLIVLAHSHVALPKTFLDSREATSRITVVFDPVKQKTTVRLAPVQVSGANDKYHSLHMAPSYHYQGREPQVPEIIDFELRTIVKGKLRIDLHVLFIVDGEKIFLSSNRWGVKKGNLGRGWMGEHLVFRMPHATFQKITRASSFEIQLDRSIFPVGEEQLESLRDLEKHINGMKITRSATR